MFDQATSLRKVVKKIAKKEAKEIKLQKRSARVITVTSGKGGVGKTNVTLNLAIKMQREGKRVVILDADLGLANIEVLFGIIPKSNLLEVVRGQKIITEVITEGPEGIKFISGGSGIQELTNLNELQLNYFIQNLSLLDKMADVILIDTGAGISETVLTFVKTADDVVLVCTPEPTAITDAYAMLKVLKSKSDEEVKNIKLIINSIQSKEEGNEISEKLQNVAEKFLDMTVEDIGRIPFDPMLSKAVKMQRPITLEYPKSQFSKALDKVVENLSVKEEKKGFEGISSFIKHFLGNFSKKEVE